MQSSQVDLANFGVPLTDPSLLSQIKSRLHSLCHTRNSSVFPGSQPVSFIRDHIQLLLTKDYYVCEKSDGVRFLLLCINSPNGPLTFLINRKYSVNLLPRIAFPADIQTNSFHHETLLDCELLVDTEQDGRLTLKLVIFDAILVCGENVMSKSLTERLSFVLKKVINPLNNASASIKQNFPFLVELKQMHKSYGLEDVLTRIIPSLKHENDGLIFTPVNYPYEIGTCNKLLKWKPAHLNTIDFRLIVQWDSNQRAYFLLYVAYSSGLQFYDYISPTSNEQAQEFVKMNGAIIECNYDSELITRINDDEPKSPPNKERIGGWKFLRMRTDKDSPNDHAVVERIIQSITQSVSEEELIKIAPDIRKNYKERERNK